ncbi:MAG: UbiA prenyltransferase family protein [Kiritimatiellia bacterium]
MSTTSSHARRHATIRDYVRIARLDHWIKNLFIMPGFFAAYMLTVKTRPCLTSLALDLVVAFLATSLVASSNYVINEWLDAQYDRFHPVKKQRPVVVAELRRPFVMAEYALLAILGLALSLLVSRLFFLMSLWLFIMGIVYNVKPLRTKDIPYLDALSESVNNMIRLLMGWFVVTNTYLPPCSLVLGYWMCGAFLMVAKRFAEYRMINDPEQAGLYRKSFRRYTESSLMVSAFCYALAALFFIGIFLVKYRVELVFSIPFLIALFGKYISLAYQDDSAAQKPEKLYREKGLMALSLAFGIALVLGFCIDFPSLDIFVSDRLIQIP